MSSMPEGTDSPTPAAGARSVATLARDLADVLVEFSIVLHKRAMYPLGHPHLQDSTTRFVERLESLLAACDSLAIGVARHQLIVASTATDPRNALLSDLARRLHRHRIATLRFERGVSAQEIDELLAGLTADPKGDQGPFGLQPDAGAGWSRLRLQPPELGRLFLQDDDGAESQPETPAGALWLGLAQLALSSDGEAREASDDPLLVARAIDTQPEQVAYDRVVLDYLGQMADEMSGRQGAMEPRVRERVSRLVTSLKPETLRRVLEAGTDHAERRRFALSASEVLAADAVIEVVEAAASTTGQTISHQLLRLLHKFAQHAERGPERGRAEAESTLRRNVAQLISDWSLEDPNPTAYTAVLEGMVRSAPSGPADPDERLECEPDTILQLALELECTGPRVEAALDALLAERRTAAVVGLLRKAPGARNETAAALWRQLATPTRLRTELMAPQPDFLMIEGLVGQLGPAATEPLLDLLERAATTTIRGKALRLLAGLGPSVAVGAAARLKDAPWYVQRNLLLLLRMLRVWPAGCSAVSFARHPEPRLRREAYKLLLEFPAHRTSAILHGLQDDNAEIVTLVLRAAVDDCPYDALRALERFTDDWRRPAELRALAVRALARSSGPQAVSRLVQLTGARRALFGWRLDAASPVAVAAIAALARHWSAHPQVTGLLKAARAHSDPQLRLAARIRSA